MLQVIEVIEFRQAPKTAPQARRRATVKQNRPFTVGEHRHQRTFLRNGFARLGDRVTGFQAKHVGFATPFQRAKQATRFAAGTERRAQVHHRLGVGVDPIMRREALSIRPELFGDLRLAGITLLRGKARQHAFDVAVEDRRAQAHADAGDRAGGGQADAGQVSEFFHVPGKLAAVLLDDDLRGLLQIARTGVVTQPRPQMKYFVFRRSSQGFDRRQRGHEAVEVIQHGADLSLLQHDFRDPYPIRVDVLLPG
ncbi:hypothetical protein D3C73_949120 [compost metagenome]